MQTIYRTPITANYSVLPNSIPTNTSLSAHARLALIYLLGKPPTWKMRISDVKRAIGCGINKAYRCLNELIRAGYAKMIRGQSRVDWFFYDTPQTSANTDRDGFHHDGNGDKLVSKDSLPSTEIHNYKPAIKQVKQDVVVVNAGAEDRPPIPIPDTLKGSQAKAATKLLRNVTESQAALILMIFTSAQKAGKVANPIGYLHALVKASQNGTLTTPESAQQARPITAGERIAKEKRLREEAQNKARVDNATFFEKMRQQYGSRFKATI